MSMSDRYIEKATVLLEELARSCGSPITYSELASKLAIAAQSTGGVLRPVLKASFEQKGVLLTILVVSKSDGIPSGDFFDQARELKVMFETELPQQFFRRHLQEVYDAYKNSSN
jgi:hypothetical protein